MMDLSQRLASRSGGDHRRWQRYWPGCRPSDAGGRRPIVVGDVDVEAGGAAR